MPKPTEERRRSFIVFAFLVAALVIGVLETREPAHILPTTEDREIIKAAAAASVNVPMWTIVCAERDSALSESARLSSFAAKGDYSPPAEEAIVDGCHWAKFRLYRPLLDSDLPKTADPSGRDGQVGWYRGDATFENGPRDGETLDDAYILLGRYIAVLLNGYAPPKQRRP